MPRTPIQKKERKVKKITTKCYGVYSKLGDSLLKVFHETYNEADDYKRSEVARCQMPKESWANAWERFNIIPCTITYKLPNNH